jgi:hypothetical protein
MGFDKSLRRPTGQIVDDEVVAFDGTSGLTKASGKDKDLIGAATGDVVGPVSATDNAVARFDSTTGKLLQNSVVTISDTGVVAGSNLVTGAASSVDNTVPRFDSTTGKLIQTSSVVIDDSNNISGLGNVTCTNLLPTADLNINAGKNLNVAGWLFTGDAATVAVSSGLIASLTGMMHKLASETVNLDGIANASSVESRHLILLAPATGTVTLRDAQAPANGKEFALGAATRDLTGYSSIWLYYNGTNWQEISYSPNT